MQVLVALIESSSILLKLPVARPPRSGENFVR
jgi:hypothetical protein